jgi:cathepsin L
MINSLYQANLNRRHFQKKVIILNIKNIKPNSFKKLILNISFILLEVPLLFSSFGCQPATQVTTTLPSKNAADSTWNSFKIKYGKSYSGSADENARYEIFLDTLSKIEKLNADNEKLNGHRPFAVNQFSDMDSNEFYKTYLTAQSVNSRKFVAHSALLSPNVAPLPPSLDWSLKGATTPIKNQGNCGSCWAFAAAEALETSLFLSTGILPAPLSTQQMVNCSTSAPNAGCGGGNAEVALEYIQNNGLVAESSYPYTSGGGNAGNCSYDKSKVVAGLNNYNTWSGNDSDGTLQQMIATSGPVTVAVNASPWQYYNPGQNNGVLSVCPRGYNHYVQLVGWNTEADGSKYWIVRNQWGSRWGLNGFIHIKMGNNLCGIAQDVSYVNAPIVVNPQPQPTVAPTHIPTPTPTGTTNTKSQIVAENSQKCLDVLNSGTLPGAPILQSNCQGGKSQNFLFYKNMDGSYTVQNENSGLCLDLTSASQMNGARLQQWTCNDTAAQRFSINSQNDGSKQIVVQKSGKCVDVTDQSTTNGALLQQWDCWGGANQSFFLPGL